MPENEVRIDSGQFIPKVGARFMATYVGGPTLGPLTRLPDEEGFKGKVKARYEDEEKHEKSGCVYLTLAHYLFMDAPSQEETK